MKSATAQKLLTAGWAYLRRFPRPTQRRGETYLHHGAVESISCVTPFEAYVAQVKGSAPEAYEVQLRCIDEDGDVDWDGDCTCAVGFDCKHIYAALATVLNRLMNDPGSIQSDAASSRSARKAKQKAAKVARVSLPESLQNALGRSLNLTETRYVKSVEEGFDEVRKRGAFMSWNATSLGFRPPGNSWDRIELWPSMPTSVLEFWNHLAYAVVHRWGGTIPEFMHALTDLETRDPAVREWRRQESIRRWTGWLEAYGTESTAPSASTDVDLRVRLMPDYAVIEIRRDEQAEFKVLKPAGARQLLQSMAGGEVAMTPNAGLIWAIISHRINYGGSPAMPYAESSAHAPLIRLLRLPSLQPCIVTVDDFPYRFATERLRWDLSEATGPDDDYTLRLVQPDGSPLPPLLFFLGGSSSSTLVGTADTIFVGPPVPGAIRHPEKEIRIPATALERAAGVGFLRGLQLDLPARLRERVKVIPFRLRIHCELIPAGHAGSSEYCRVTVTARSDDGAHQQMWTGANWVDEFQATPPAARKKKGAPDLEPAIVSYDRSALADTARLLAPLNLRWNGWQACGDLRVTKKFPEEFSAWRQTIPPDVELTLEGELSSLVTESLAGKVRLNVAEAGIDWFDLTVLLDVTETDLTQEEINLLLNAKGGYVRLKGKGWRRLKFDLTEEEDERLARLGLNPRELTAEPQRLHVLQLADQAARRFLPEEQFDRVHRRASELKARVTPELPAGIQAELRPYQRDGFNFLCYLSTNRFGGILADDMGLGKTLQTLAWILWLRSAEGPDAGQPGPILVVCPKSVMDNWQRETARFAPSLKARIWGAGELETLVTGTTSADLHIINYNQLRQIGESLAPVNWQAVILDEGQYIKNPGSQTAQVARSLRAGHRLVLSGTPIENRLMDLWSLMTFAMPGVLGSRSQFGKMFGGSDDPFARRRLAARVRPFLIRRTKTQVAKDLPDRIEEDLLCEMEGEQKTLYRAELKVAQQILLKIQTKQQLAKERFHFLTSLLRLRQICCDPRLVKADSTAPSAKLEALIEQLEPLMEEGQKVLVFSQFVTMLDLVRDALQEKGWPLSYLAGDTENRGELVENFQSAPGPGVFLISLKAGGFGLNLTSAGYVVIFDPWWNPAVENQAIDRTHRIGQKQNVIAYRFLMKDSIEEKIRALQKHKKNLAEDVLGEEKFAQSLTLDDLRFLLAD